MSELTITPGLSVAYGKTMYDIMRLRNKMVENVPDVVAYPDTKEQVEQIVAYCQQEKIPVYVYGGGSSVTRGVECMKGGISLDMRLRFDKVIEFNEKDQTITVQAGMSRPQLEKVLNNAVELFGAKEPIPAAISLRASNIPSCGRLGGHSRRRCKTLLTTAAFRTSS